MMANATLNTLKANNEDMDLKISAFSLGKIWFKILNADKDTEVQVGLHNVAQKKVDRLYRIKSTNAYLCTTFSSRHLEVMEREKPVRG
jgi:hypothetical protein